MRYRSKSGFTLIELFLCIAVAAVVISLVVAVGQYVRASSYSTICMNNLRQISLAVANYYNDHKEYPLSLPYNTLHDQLKTYITSKQSFVCPADKFESSDSYSQFYVFRGKEITNSQYLIGCPRHKNDKFAMNIFALGTSKNGPVAEVKVDQVRVKPGEICDSGTMTLEDGSTIASSGVSMMLVQSFRMEDGRLYSIIKVSDGEQGSVTVDVIPGSALEIVTPSSIAAVRGTTFVINISYENNQPVSKFGVTAGEIAVTPLNGKTMVNGNLVDMGVNEISLLPGQKIDIYGENIKVNTESLEEKLLSLRNKVDKAIDQGEDPKKDIKLYRWLAKFLNNNQDLPDWYYDDDIESGVNIEDDKTNPVPPENPTSNPGQDGSLPPGQTVQPSNPGQDGSLPPGQTANSQSESQSESESESNNSGGGFWHWFFKFLFLY